jgi:hypothetical protein
MGVGVNFVRASDAHPMICGAQADVLENLVIDLPTIPTIEDTNSTASTRPTIA